MTTTAALVSSAVIGLLGCTPTASVRDLGSGSGFCVGACTPDPGWSTVNCEAAEAGLEFFEPAAINAQVGTTATALYSYVDNTSRVFVFGDGSSVGQTATYQPPTMAASPARCTSGAQNRLIHIAGGPFLGWGGGIGVGLSNLITNGTAIAAHPESALPASEPSPVRSSALDVSMWDGVAVWARRGPDSQPLIRVLVGNKYTDDDVSFLMYRDTPGVPRYCERVKECACTFRNLTCDFAPTALGYPNGGYFCGAPGQAPGPAIMAPTSSDNARATNTCNVTHCDDQYPAYPNDAANVPASDPQFVGRPCTPYTFRNGTQSSYCFDPAKDPPPAQSTEQCGDHWTFPLHLSTEWQLYLVPFTTMYQQGWAKKWPFFDLKSVSVVRLTWEAGNIDYWIASMRFYRVKR